jgi:CPA1 family monovalent cation:H+ antiporter
MIDAERRRVLEIRSTGTVPHEVVAEVLAMLDVEESMLDYSEGERQRVRATVGAMSRDGGCEHLRDLPSIVDTNTPGVCEECVAEGGTWVHLRLCLSCGHVGCCDSSPRRHATAHYHATEHPVVRSAEPGESWRWCYVDELTA